MLSHALYHCPSPQKDTYGSNLVGQKLRGFLNQTVLGLILAQSLNSLALSKLVYSYELQCFSYFQMSLIMSISETG